MTQATEVLVVTHTAKLGGAELALLRLCEAMPSNCRVTVISFEEGELVDRLRALSISVDVLKSPGDWATRSRNTTGRPLGFVRLTLGAVLHAIRLGARIRSIKPHVVQSWTLKAHLVTTLAYPLYRRPLVWYLHDRITDEYLGTINRLMVEGLSRVPDVVLANSIATAATITRSCVVAYPGLSSAQYVAHSEVRSRAAPHTPELMLLGRISETKGQRETILAFKRVLRVVPTARLRIVGRPLFGGEAYEQGCRALVSELGLDHAVEFLGHSSDPRQDLDRATVLLHASPVAEPFGQVVAEAMARGVPVIGTDAGGVPEMLNRDGQQYGYLVPPGDHVALADAVIHVIRNPAEASARAQRAYALAHEVFTIEDTAAAFTRVWRSCAKHPLHGTRLGRPQCYRSTYTS